MYRNRLFGLILVFGCSPPPHAFLDIEDPNSTAVGAIGLFVGTDASELEPVRLDTELTFPIQITVTAVKGGKREVTVEARGDAGTAMARATKQVELKRREALHASVELATACATDEECQGEAFCDGTGRCQGGTCVFVDNPCTANFPCIISTCIEEAKRCDVTPSFFRLSFRVGDVRLF